MNIEQITTLQLSFGEEWDKYKIFTFEKLIHIYIAFLQNSDFSFLNYF